MFTSSVLKLSDKKSSFEYFHSTWHHDILNFIEKILYLYSNEHEL
jgi:hypothetical protein